MATVLTGTEIKAIVTPNVNLDPAYFEKNIENWERLVLCPVMTTDLFNAFKTNLENPPLTTRFQTLIDDYIQYAEAYGVTYDSIKKDLFSHLDNKGVMQNFGDKGSTTSSVAIQLKEYQEKTWQYLYQLGCYLIDNISDYPEIDLEDPAKTPQLGTPFRDNMPI